MPLETPQLQNAILQALEESSKIDADAESATDNASQSKNARQKTAELLASAIETFVKSGTVTTNVTTTGSASAQTGTGTGKIT